MSSDDGELLWRLPDHESPAGKQFATRNEPLAVSVAAAAKAGLWQYFRRHAGPAGLEATVDDEAGRRWTGLNIGSQDYLGLASDPRVAEGAIAAIRSYGVHSSGSAPMGGGSILGDRLAASVSAQTSMPNTLLFPTGWAAGYGTIRGLVRPYDHVVMDALAHNCLQHGAAAATPNVHLYIHNSTDSLEKRLSRIRAKEPDAAILIVTEGLFSMDSDTPDLGHILELRDKFEATLLVDVAHDFGVLGATGRGALEAVGLLDAADILVGSFSKTFASIGGFAAFRALPSMRAVQGFSGSYTFSNYLIPPQIGAVQAAFDITFSPEGNQLRAKVLANTAVFREALKENGVETIGRLSPMTIALVGDEGDARVGYRTLLEAGIILNCIEFPAVRRGEARYRVQLTPQHQTGDLIEAAKVIGRAVGQGSRPAR